MSRDLAPDEARYWCAGSWTTGHQDTETEQEGGPGNTGNGSLQAVPCVSVFLGGLRRPVAGVAGAALPSCCVCWWAVSLLRRSRKPRRRSGPAPAQRDGAGVGGAETGPATFLDPGGRSREAQRSGFSPWKRSFCASGRDRDRTVSCRWSPAPRFDCSGRRERNLSVARLWPSPTSGTLGGRRFRAEKGGGNRAGARHGPLDRWKGQTQAGAGHRPLEPMERPDGPLPDFCR